MKKKRSENPNQLLLNLNSAADGEHQDGLFSGKSCGEMIDAAIGKLRQMNNAVLKDKSAVEARAWFAWRFLPPLCKALIEGEELGETFRVLVINPEKVRAPRALDVFQHGRN